MQANIRSHALLSLGPLEREVDISTAAEEATKVVLSSTVYCTDTIVTASQQSVSSTVRACQVYTEKSNNVVEIVECVCTSNNVIPQRYIKRNISHYANPLASGQN